jgi:curved DNA-binding protein CbpA
MSRAHLDRDYYATLGLHTEATEDEIRKAYRRLALEWHPDRRPGDPRAGDRFKEISEAYAVLSNPSTRREYDRARAGGGAFRHTREDLLRDLFASPRASAVFEELAREFERRGMRVDRRYFQHTLLGGRVVVSGGLFIISPISLIPPLFRLARAAVRGSRGSPGVSGPEARPLQGRPGLLAGLTRLGRGLLALTARATAGPPPAIGAEDVTLPLRLTRREAKRGAQRRVTLDWVREPEEVLVTIPAGVRSGTRLRLRGKGRARPDGTRGDAYLAVELVEGS